MFIPISVDAEVVGSSPTWGTNVCLGYFCLCCPMQTATSHHTNQVFIIRFRDPGDGRLGQYSCVVVCHTGTKQMLLNPHAALSHWGLCVFLQLTLYSKKLYQMSQLADDKWHEDKEHCAGTRHYATSQKAAG
jgi:hypothetical protein